MSRLDRLGVFVVSMLLLPHLSVGAQTAPTDKVPLPGTRTVLDSLGANALNAELGLLPADLQLEGLRMGQYRNVSAAGRDPVLGPFGVAYSAPARSDSMVVQLSFVWSVEDAIAESVPDDPLLGSLYVSWTGRNERDFVAMYDRFYRALRSSPMSPSCVDLKTNRAGSDFARRSREAAWQAGGWHAGLFVRKSVSSTGTFYLIQYRASHERFMEMPPDAATTDWVAVSPARVRGPERAPQRSAAAHDALNCALAEIYPDALRCLDPAAIGLTTIWYGSPDG